MKQLYFIMLFKILKILFKLISFKLVLVGFALCMVIIELFIKCMDEALGCRI